jgi:hypothetical protein
MYDCGIPYNLKLPKKPTSVQKTRCVTHTLAFAIYMKKYHKAKERLWKLEYFTMQKYNLQKNPLKKTQNPSRYYNSVTNIKFQHKPKYHLSKILI